MYPKVTTLSDIDIAKTRDARILQTIAESYSVPQNNTVKEAKRKRLETCVQVTRSSETVAKAISQVQPRQRRRTWRRLVMKGVHLISRFQAMVLQIPATVLTNNRNLWANPYLGRDWCGRGRSSSQGYGHAQRPNQARLAQSRSLVIHPNWSCLSLQGTSYCTRFKIEKDTERTMIKTSFRLPT